MWKKTGKYIIILLVSFAALVFAETIAINASVDKQTVPINETLQLTISLDGTHDLPGISLPALTDFEVLGQSSSTQIQIINGRQSSSRSFVFTLRPKKQGKANIPAMSFNYQNNSFTTTPLEIAISGYATPNAQPAAQRSAFSLFDENSFFNTSQNLPESEVSAELTPRKYTLYAGEKTLLDFRLYYERGFYNGPAIEPPKLDGFVARDLANNAKNQQTVENNGKKLNLFIQTKEIYPLQSGIFSIPALTVQYISSPFGGVQKRTTKPFTINVKKLPEPQPDNFSGAIGVFTLKVDFENKSKLQIGTALPIKITIQGQGNLDMINEIKLELPDGLNLYLDSLDTKGTYGISAKRVFNYFLTPSQGGEYVLPDLAFNYFDPAKASYQNIKYSLPKLKVSGGKIIRNTIYDTDNNGLDVENGAVNIRLDKQLVAGFIGLLKKTTPLLILLGIFAAAIIFTMSKVFSPLNILKKKLANLKIIRTDQEFINEAHELLNKLVKLKYKLNPSGLSISELESRLEDKPSAQAIVDLARKFEELKYTGNNQVSETDKNLIIQKLENIFG